MQLRYDIENIQKGDVIFLTNRDGFTAGGGSNYGNGSFVTEVTDNLIKTKDKSFDKKHGLAASPPWAYKIGYYQKAKHFK